MLDCDWMARRASGVENCKIRFCCVQLWLRGPKSQRPGEPIACIDSENVSAGFCRDENRRNNCVILTYDLVARRARNNCVMLNFDWVAWRASGLENSRINFWYVYLWLLGSGSYSWRAVETIVQCWFMMPETWRAQETIVLFTLWWNAGLGDIAAWTFETVVALCNVKKVSFVFAVCIVHFCFGLGLILSLRWRWGDLLSVSIPDLIRSLRSTGCWVSL